MPHAVIPPAPSDYECIARVQGGLDRSAELTTKPGIQSFFKKITEFLLEFIPTCRGRNDDLRGLRPLF
jgi:hypothetical protein